MKRLLVVAAALLGACSSLQPSDPFAQHLCRAQSFASCPTDIDSPARLADESRPRG